LARELLLCEEAMIDKEILVWGSDGLARKLFDEEAMA
jgi:hypothetical protein